MSSPRRRTHSSARVGLCVHASQNLISVKNYVQINVTGLVITSTERVSRTPSTARVFFLNFPQQPSGEREREKKKTCLILVPLDPRHMHEDSRTDVGVRMHEQRKMHGVDKKMEWTPTRTHRCEAYKRSGARSHLTSPFLLLLSKLRKARVS